MPEILQHLINGNKRFKQKYFNDQSTLFEELVRYGQKPKVMIVACSDSRVDPSVILNAQPGEIFVVRNIANLVPPCENNDSFHGISAALEFGTCFLEVQHIIVLGHTQCGGIQALLENTQRVFSKKPDSFIGKWMDLARPAYDKIVTEHNDAPLQEKITLCEQYALINSLHNLQSFPWIQERLQNGKIAIHAWYFDLATGNLHTYDSSTNQWLLP